MKLKEEILNYLSKRTDECEKRKAKVDSLSKNYSYLQGYIDALDVVKVFIKNLTGV